MCASDQKLSPGRARSGSKPSRRSFNSEGKNVPLLPVFSPDARLTMSHFVAAHVFSVKFTLRATSEEFCWERTVLEKNSMHFANARDLTDAQCEILCDLIPEPPRREDGRGRTYRINRRNTTQDLRRLRRYRRRWKIERLFAWLQNFRRLVVPYERYAENFLGMLYLGCCLILLRHL